MKRGRKPGQVSETFKTKKPIEIGAEFGFLKVIAGPGRERRYGKPWIVYLCQCVCGKRLTLPDGTLRSGKTETCGCKAHWPRVFPAHLERMLHESNAPQEFVNWYG